MSKQLPKTHLFKNALHSGAFKKLYKRLRQGVALSTSKCACYFKEVPVFSHYCAFVWTGLSDTCGREFF